jgi:hypothetical protein
LTVAVRPFGWEVGSPRCSIVDANRLKLDMG